MSEEQSSDQPLNEPTVIDDSSILASIYAREKKHRLDEMEKFRDNLNNIFPNFEKHFNESLDDFIINQTKKTLSILKTQVYGLPKPPAPPNERTHLWIGVNPPPKTVSLDNLWVKASLAVLKYKWLKCHAYCIEAHTKNGYRPHLHIMAVSDEKPNRVISALANHFCLDKQSIECKAHHKGHLFGEHYDYIIGAKADAKMKDVDLDILERKKYDIPNYIQNIIL